MARVRVLLADDNKLFRDGVARILNADRRFRVVGLASDGEEAVAAAASLKPDLVLLDLNMPKMDGLEAVKRIRGNGSDVPIGILTILETHQEVRPALLAGANGYLPKDATPEELCEAAAALAAGKTTQLHLSLEDDAASKPRGALSVLTQREFEVLKSLATGKANRDIARDLGISPKTLRNHISTVYHKLGIYDRAQAVIVAVREGVVSVTDLA